MDRIDVEIQKPLTGTNAIKVSEDELKTLAEKGWNRVNVANDQAYGNVRFNYSEAQIFPPRTPTRQSYIVVRDETHPADQKPNIHSVYHS